MSCPDSPASETFSLSMSDFEQVAETVEPTVSAECREPVEQNTTGNQGENTRRSRNFDFEDGSEEFLVGGEIYRVHRFLFSRDSPHFARLFESLSLLEPIEPIELPNTTREEFDALLDVLYCPCYRQPRISSFSEWSSVLRLATEWSFDAIRALAIDKLEVIATPVEKINLCHAFDIPQWLQGAYVALCTRPTSLLADEIRLLKAEDAELIMSVREDTLRSGLLAPRESDVSTRIAKLMAPHSEANSPPCPSNSPSPPSSESPPPLSETIISLLDKLQADVFYSVSDEIVKYVNSTNDEPDASTLREVIKAIWERAVTGIDAPEAELYAHLSRKLMQGLSPAVRDLSIVGRDGRPICGGHLFLKILLDRCQDEVEALLPAQGGNESLPTTATPSTLRRGHTVTMTRNHYSNFGRFIGELFKMQMLTERIMHACVKAPLTPLDGVNHPNEEQIAFLCSLLSTAGSILDAPKARAHFDVYFSRIQRMKTSVHATPYMVEMLEDIISLRENKWQRRVMG